MKGLDKTLSVSLPVIPYHQRFEFVCLYNTQVHSTHVVTVALAAAFSGESKLVLYRAERYDQLNKTKAIVWYCASDFYLNKDYVQLYQ